MTLWTNRTQYIKWNYIKSVVSPSLVTVTLTLGGRFLISRENCFHSAPRNMQRRSNVLRFKHYDRDTVGNNTRSKQNDSSHHNCRFHSRNTLKWPYQLSRFFWVKCTNSMLYWRNVCRVYSQCMSWKWLYLITWLNDVRRHMYKVYIFHAVFMYNVRTGGWCNGFGVL